MYGSVPFYWNLGYLHQTILHGLTEDLCSLERPTWLTVEVHIQYKRCMLYGTTVCNKCVKSLCMGSQDSHWNIVIQTVDQFAVVCNMAYYRKKEMDLDIDHILYKPALS